MDRRKVISDWIIATQETVYILQMWLGLLEGWRERGQAEPDDFMEAYHQLKEAELGQWASQAGGHGIKALAESVQVKDILPDEVNGRRR